MTTALRERRISAGQPKERPACKLREKIIDELWAKYEPGLGRKVVSKTTGESSSPSPGATIRRRT